MSEFDEDLPLYGDEGFKEPEARPKKKGTSKPTSPKKEPEDKVAPPLVLDAEEVLELAPALALDTKKFGLSKDKAKGILASFAPVYKKQLELEKKFQALIVKEINKETCKEARELRLAFKAEKTSGTNIHKEEKAEFLSGGRAVDELKNYVVKISKTREDQLEQIEKYFEIQREKEEARLFEERKAQLLEFEPYSTEAYYDFGRLNLGVIPDEVFEGVLEAARKKDLALKEERLEALRKEELRKEAEKVWHKYLPLSEYSEKQYFFEDFIGRSSEESEALIKVLEKRKVKKLVDQAETKRLADEAAAKVRELEAEAEKKRLADLKLEEQRARDEYIRNTLVKTELGWEVKGLKHTVGNLIISQEALESYTLRGIQDEVRNALIEEAQAEQAANKEKPEVKLQKWISGFALDVEPEGLEKDARFLEISKRFDAFKKWAHGIV